MVFAGRRGRYESVWRLASSKAFKLLLHLLSRGRVPSDAGLFVAISREVIDLLLEYRVRSPYVVALMARTGKHFASIPVERSTSKDRPSAYNTRTRLNLALRALHIALMCRNGRPATASQGVSASQVPIAEFFGDVFKTSSGQVSQGLTGRRAFE